MTTIEVPESAGTRASDQRRDRRHPVLERGFEPGHDLSCPRALRDGARIRGRRRRRARCLQPPLRLRRHRRRTPHRYAARGYGPMRVATQHLWIARQLCIPTFFISSPQHETTRSGKRPRLGDPTGSVARPPVVSLAEAGQHPAHRWSLGARSRRDSDPLKRTARRRIRILGRGNGWRRLRLQTSAAMNTSPLTLRSDLDHQELAG